MIKNVQFRTFFRFGVFEREKKNRWKVFFFLQVHPHFVLYGMWIHAFRN